MKKLLAVILGLILMLSATGCGNDVAEETGTRELYIFMNNGAASAGSSSNDADLELVHQNILDETGIDLKLLSAGTGAEKEKLNVLLASGERIDVFWGAWPNYAKDDIIIPIGDLLEKHGKDILDVTEKTMWPAVTDTEGNIWGIPRNPALAAMPTFVRTDWLEKCGLEVPKTLDDIENVLKTFKEKDPAGNGNTIPLVLQYAGIKRGLSAAFTGVGYGPWVDVNDGNKVKPAELHPGYRKMVEKVADWYAKGYIDREGFAIKQPQIREQIKQNKVGMHMEWYSNITLFEPDLNTNFPEAHYEIVEWEGPAGRAETINKPSQNALLITKQCKNPEDVIKLVNWAHQDLDNYYTIQYGVEGTHWDYANEDKTYIVERNPEKKTYFSDYNFALGCMEYRVDRDNPNVTRHQQYLFDDILNYDRAVKSLDFDIFFDSELLKEDIPTLSDINRMMEEEIIRFITGVRPMSDWDNFIDDLYEIGMDTYIEVYTREYNKLSK